MTRAAQHVRLAERDRLPTCGNNAMFYNLQGLARDYLDQPKWSAMREASYGHATLDFETSTTATFRWHRNQVRSSCIGQISALSCSCIRSFASSLPALAGLLGTIMFSQACASPCSAGWRGSDSGRGQTGACSSVCWQDACQQCSDSVGAAQDSVGACSAASETTLSCTAAVYVEQSLICNWFWG